MVHHMRSDGEDKGDGYGWWGYGARCDGSPQGRARERALVAGVGCSGVGVGSSSIDYFPSGAIVGDDKALGKGPEYRKLEVRATGEGRWRPWVGLASGAGLF